MTSASPISADRATYIPTLDGWRCVAISFVLLAHTWAWLGVGTTKLARILHYPHIDAHITRFGQMGVGLFFCISGFLITKLLLDHGTSLTTFYVRRAFRILPAALVYLMCVGALGGLGVFAVYPREILASLFFYRNYLDRIGPLTGHFWSLSIEEQFYLIWPSLLAPAGIKRSRMLALIGIVGILVWRQIHWPLPNFAYFHTDMRLDSILCGCVLALCWPALKSLFEKVPPVAIAAAVLVYFVVDSYIDALGGVADTVQAFLACLLIGCTVAVPARFSARILELSPLKWLGRRSYSIYLWQQPFLLASHNPHWQLPLRLAGIIGLAWLSYEFVERPMIASGRRLLNSESLRKIPQRPQWLRRAEI